MIFQWSGSEDSVDYVGASEDDDKKLQWHDKIMGTPLVPLADWEPPNVVQSIERGARKQPGDAPMSRLVNLISKRASTVLKDIWDRHATLYPLQVVDHKDEELFMVVAHTVLDCIDRTASTGPLQNYGPTPELFAYVEKWVFDESAIGDDDLFVLPDSPTSIFVSEQFKRRVAEAGLEGFCLLSSYWDDDPWISPD